MSFKKLVPIFKILIFLYLVLGASLTMYSQVDSVNSFIVSLGLDSLSEDGKDTLYYHTINDMPGTFWLPNSIRNQKTILETKQVFQDIFKSKMNEEDLQVINDYWDKRQSEYVERILESDSLYVSALSCQKLVIDSLKSEYIDDLRNLSVELNSLLSDSDIIRLINHYEERLTGYRNKEYQFINHAERFTGYITTSRIEYLRYGFQIMDMFPSSYYLDLVGGTTRRLRFPNEILKTDYVNKYLEFETAMELQLTMENNCRAHKAVPFYHTEIKNHHYHSIVSSLLFAYVNKLIRNVEDVEIEQRFNWPELETIKESDGFTFIQIVGGNKINESDFVVRDVSDNNETLLTSKSDQFTNLIITTYSKDKLVDELALFKEKNKFNTIETNFSDLLDVYYVNSTDSDFYITDGILHYKSYLLFFNYLTLDFNEDKMILHIRSLFD